MPGSLRYVALGVLGCASLIPNVATAAPIADLESAIVGGVLIVNAHHSLSWEDVQVLVVREDRGWHLGWFKDKDSSLGVFASQTPDVASGAIGDTLTSTAGAPGSSSPAAGSGPTAVSLPSLPGLTASGGDAGVAAHAQADLSHGADLAISAPEPAALVLFGAGLLWVGRRLRLMRARTLR